MPAIIDTFSNAFKAVGKAEGQKLSASQVTSIQRAIKMQLETLLKHPSSLDLQDRVRCHCEASWPYCHVINSLFLCWRASEQTPM